MIPDLTPLLCSLCEMDPPEITGQSIWESADGPALAALCSLGALVHVGNSECVLCLECDHPHSINVEFVGQGDYRAFCQNSGFQVVRPDVLRRFAVDEEWIARTVGSKFDLRILNKRSPVTPFSFLRIGCVRLGFYRFELFFARRISDRTRFDQVTKSISKLLGRSPGILLTTTPRDLVPGRPPPRCALLMLADVLCISDTKIALDEGPFYAALRGPDYAFPGDVVGCAFSPGYRSVVVGDQAYSFSDKQALAVEALDLARRNGNPRLHQTEIQGEAGTTQRVVQLFAGHPAYGRLIKGDGHGYYWLDL